MQERVRSGRLGRKEGLRFMRFVIVLTYIVAKKTKKKRLPLPLFPSPPLAFFSLDVLAYIGTTAV